jgi:hypothetical protein
MSDNLTSERRYMTADIGFVANVWHLAGPREAQMTRTCNETASCTASDVVVSHVRW